MRMVRAVQGNIHHELSIQVCVLRELFRSNSALEGHYKEKDQTVYSVRLRKQNECLKSQLTLQVIWQARLLKLCMLD